MLDALAEGDVGQVLVALSALLAGGWGPQQLATELIDDLRQVFLAALAPELCTVSGPSLERFRAVAEAMGLARVVRSMEILGHALVDMREAPDAQVVLEIGAVRAVRPDLDSGMEALSERVSVLERAQSGAPAFPRPGGTAAPSAPAESDGGARCRRHRSPRRPPDRRPRWPGGLLSVPCGAARRQPRQRNRRRRRRPPKRHQRWNRSPSPRRRPSGPRRCVGGICVERIASSAAGAAPAGATKTLDRDDLTEAWGDGILQSLPARAKARYASGRFVAVDEQGAHFALPNAAHREQCVEQQADVEKALSDHFGTKVALVLLVDDSLAPPAAGPGPSPAASPRPPGGAPPPPPPPAEEVDYVDPSELEDASTDQASAAQARLLQAFPGASEVAE